MSRVGSAGGLAIFCLAIAASPVASQQDQRTPVFRGGVTFVNVDVYPRENGRLVEGLTASDFQVFEDGKPQKIDAFEFIKIPPNAVDAERRDPGTKEEGDTLAADPHNRVFVVYLDLYHTTFAGAQDIKRPLVDFLSRTIGASDLFTVMTPEVSPRQLVFGRRLETLEGELTKYFDWGTRDRAISPKTPTEEQLETCMTGAAPSLGDALVALYRDDLMATNLEELMLQLRDLRDERKNLLLISEGWVPRPPQSALANLGSGQLPRIGTGPTGRLGIGGRQGSLTDRTWCDQQIARLANIDFEQRFKELLTLANRANVSFYPVDVGGLRTPFQQGPARTARPLGNTPEERLAVQIVSQSTVSNTTTLRVLAENTDGRAIVDTNDLGASLRRMSDDLSAYYLLGYASTNQQLDGKYRRIEVKVNRPKVSVNARPGYLAPRADVVAASAAAAAKAVLPASIADELSRLAHLRADAQLFSYGVPTATGVDVVAEISSREMESGKWRAGADVRATVSSGGRNVTATATIEPGARAAVVHVPLAAAGDAAWHVDVRVSHGGDTLDDRADIAASPRALLGAPVLYRGTAAPRIPLRPVADFQFRRNERLHVEWAASKPLDQRLARVLDRRGQPLAINAAVSEPTPGTVAVDLNLAPLAEGDYLIELTAGAAETTDRSLIAFRIVR